MKTHHPLATLSLSLLFAHSIALADQTIPGNLTVQQDSWLYGVTSFGHLTENPQTPGLWLGVSQDGYMTTQTNVVTPGYWTTQSVVVEDYGWVENGYYTPIFDYVTINDYFPPVYDSDGILITDGYTSSRIEYQQTGQTWNSNSTWGITGSHTEQQPVWIPDVVENVEVTNYGAPRVAFTAPRSDTNYDFMFPSSYGGGMWRALSIYNGGLMMGSENGWRSVSLTPQYIQQYGYNTDGSQYNAVANAEGAQHYAWKYNSTSYVYGVSELRADTLQFRRTEYFYNGTNVTAQTQIAARSAQFGGAVTVEGNLNVKGPLRLLPAGDLDMGAFHKGAKPDGTVDNGN